MHLRRLDIQDAPLMLEWMHDESVVKDLRASFSTKQLKDCIDFINNSHQDSKNLHLAISGENNEYLGTVSLKNMHDEVAEFAIAIRSVAMGKGIAKKAMDKIIEIGFKEKHLNTIFWCVSPENKRAVRFYDKNGYCRVSSSELKTLKDYSDLEIQAYYWYLIKKDREE